MRLLLSTSILPMSTHARGLGVNLTGASHMILYDVFWNCGTLRLLRWEKLVWDSA